MIRQTLAATLLVLGTVGAFAANAGTPHIDQRQANQERRIDQGIRSGELTARETHRLDRQQTRIAANEAAAKADGVVTHAERAEIRAQQRYASQTIYRKKHNARDAN